MKKFTVNTVIAVTEPFLLMPKDSLLLFKGLFRRLYHTLKLFS